jgi:hypothetical protein
VFIIMIAPLALFVERLNGCGCGVPGAVRRNPHPGGSGGTNFPDLFSARCGHFRRVADFAKHGLDCVLAAELSGPFGLGILIINGMNADAP